MLTFYVQMGAGVGIAAVVCAVYIGELAPTKLRGRLIAIQSVYVAFCCAQVAVYSRLGAA